MNYKEFCVYKVPRQLLKRVESRKKGSLYLTGMQNLVRVEIMLKQIFEQSRIR